MGSRAKPSGIHLTALDAAIVKGMLARGDRQHDIAAWFGVNGGRIAEVATGASFSSVPAADATALAAPRALSSRTGGDGSNGGLGFGQSSTGRSRGYDRSASAVGISRPKKLKAVRGIARHSLIQIYICPKVRLDRKTSASVIATSARPLPRWHEAKPASKGCG